VTESPYKGKSGPQRVINATRYSAAGLAAAWRHEAAFRSLALLCAVLVPLGVWLGKTPADRALLCGSALLMLVVEAVNAAVEAAVDRVSYESNPLAKRAKDLGSAAVMLAMLNAGVIWLLVLATA
jgi:diacylglycerol kinase (ATP)